MIANFLREEKAQGAVEYIMFVGGIFVGVTVIWIVFSKMSGSSANKLDETSYAASSVMSARISEDLAAIF
jgi:ABC-type lipoprotein release transport system permease subunit